MDDLALVWLAAPVTGLLVQPVIGYLSDNTWHPTWGRRRPFFFLGAVLAATALFLMSNSAAIWMAVVVLWVMDASINISMEPFTRCLRWCWAASRWSSRPCSRCSSPTATARPPGKLN